MSSEINKNDTKGVEDKKRFEKYCEKYSTYFEPVIIADSDYVVIYKNISAKSYILKLQMKKNVLRSISAESVGRFNAAEKNAVPCVVDFDIPAPFTRSIANIEELEYIDVNGRTSRKRIFIFVFFASINFMKSDNSYKNDMFEMIEAFNNQKLSLNQDMQYRLKDLEGQFEPVQGDKDRSREEEEDEKKHRQVKFINANHKKIMRLQNHFNAYIDSVDDRNVDRREKFQRDMSDFFINLKSELEKYMRKNGYALTSSIVYSYDKREEFLAKIDEKNFAMMNIILFTFAFKYAESATVHQRFTPNSEENIAVVAYEFDINERFIYEYDKYAQHNNSEFLIIDEDIASIDGLDLKVASLIASSNSSELTVKANFASKKAAVELVIKGVASGDSNIIHQHQFSFSEEQIQNMLDIELSEISFLSSDVH